MCTKKHGAFFAHRLEELLKERDVDKATIERQQQQLAEVEPELNLSRKKIQNIEAQNAQDKMEVQYFQQELTKTKIVRFPYFFV